MKICGLDVHKKKIVAHILDVSANSDGAIQAETLHASIFNRSPTGLGELSDFLKKHSVSTVVLESTGPYGLPVYYFLESEGFDVWMAHAKDNRPKNQKKTDMADAERLARGFVSRSIRAYKLPSNPKIRRLRDLTRTRKKLVEERVRIKNMIIRIFDEMCIDIKEVFKSIGKGALVFIEGFAKGMSLDAIISKWPKLAEKREELEKIVNVKLTAERAIILRSLIRIIKTVDAEIDRMNKMIESLLAELGEDVQLLMTVPGIGIHASAIILAEIGNISRFASPKKLASYAGLVPSVYQSGGKTIYGKLRKDCNKRLRWIFYEIALKASKSSPRLRAFYERLISRGKAKKQALIAVARKIAVGVWHILAKKVPWNEQIKKRPFRPKKT